MMLSNGWVIKEFESSRDCTVQFLETFCKNNDISIVMCVTPSGIFFWDEYRWQTKHHIHRFHKKNPLTQEELARIALEYPEDLMGTLKQVFFS